MTLALEHSRQDALAPTNLAGLTRGELRAALVEGGIAEARQAGMRAAQVWRWIHHHGATDFARMTNIAKEARWALSERFALARPRVIERKDSADGVIKWLIGFAPGIEAETVFIPDVGRSGALCVSSQVGCTLNCAFCFTGTQALVRNLSAAEIVAQVQVARDDLAEWNAADGERRISNVVFMGMGEPLYNLDAVAAALDIISDNEGIAISRRRITVSTAGVVPKLEELGQRTGAMLAISLHATNDKLRDELVPLNKRWPIAELMAAVRAYPGLSNARRVTFEYVMLKGVNDSPAEARALVRLAAGIPAKINLIPYNPWPGDRFETSEPEAIERFAAIVRAAGYASPVRTPRGRDILAACGQLRSESRKTRASARRAAEEAARA
ncbi:MAG TPA: 23S rRNA (adenine(2503)-C(2))-methyltransferase RlmN [Caulobacteraceae bacterium]|nr:23S rRNA (adenine(2503)-C(2))-methyltransferase RlmN [Caulobacteraceae bacterium]